MRIKKGGGDREHLRKTLRSLIAVIIRTFGLKTPEMSAK